MKEKQKDVFEKMVGVLETNYNNYLKHVKDLKNLFNSKFQELKRLKINSKNVSEIMIQSFLEKNELIQFIKEKEEEMEKIKNECKILKEQKK